MGRPAAARALLNLDPEHALEASIRRAQRSSVSSREPGERASSSKLDAFADLAEYGTSLLTAIG
jgi:hypothetical protein